MPLTGMINYIYTDNNELVGDIAVV